MPIGTKVTLHMVASLDGFIAKHDGAIDWMHSHDQYTQGEELTQEEIELFLQQIDCYIMGSRTYEHTLQYGWPYGEVPVWVVTKRPFETERETVTFYNGDITELVERELHPRFRNSWLVGGAALTKSFLQARLVDEIVITILPILLGGGKSFFDAIGQEQKLHLKDHRAFKDGMVELTYEILK